jgi:hypothetical protein
MSQFDYDYELSFTNDFDVNVILESELLDKSQDLQNNIQGEVEKIKLVLGLHSGVHKLSTFHTYNDTRYKVTLEKTV